MAWVHPGQAIIGSRREAATYSRESDTRANYRPYGDHREGVSQQGEGRENASR